MTTHTLSCALALSLAATTVGAQGMARGANFLETWDQDGDGAVTQAEVAERRADIFATFDADGDGVLSDTEFAALNETRETTRARMMDNMGMGMGGMGRGMGRGMAMGLADAEGFQKAMNDTDGDGQVTRDEFVQRTPFFFKRMDRDGDGQITEQDFGRN